MSEKMKLNKEDGVKMLKGLGIAVGGAAMAYLAELLPMIDFGQYDKVAMIIGMLVVNVSRKFLTKN